MSDEAQKKLIAAYEQQMGEGNLSMQAYNVLNKAAQGAAPRIAAAMGVSAFLTKSAQNAYILVIVDDSGSIEAIYDAEEEMTGPELIVMAHNAIIDALMGSSAVRQSATFFGTQLLNPNGQTAWHDPDDFNAPINDYLALSSPSLSRLVHGSTGNYRTNKYHLTPLNGSLVNGIGAAIAILNDLDGRNIDGRLEVLLLTDGMQFGPDNHEESDVKALLDSTRERVNVTLMGLVQPNATASMYEGYANRAGIQTVLTALATAKEIREAVGQFSSQAAQTASGQGMFNDSEQGGGW